MKHRRRIVALAVGSLFAGTLASNALADTAAAQKWVDSEFQPSTLSKQQQMDEMKWFIDTAAKLKSQGVKEVHVVSDEARPPGADVGAKLAFHGSALHLHRPPYTLLTDTRELRAE